jgi:Cu-Zn family superoxide dismutase
MGNKNSNTNQNAICFIDNEHLKATITFKQLTYGTEITFDIQSKKPNSEGKVHAIHIHEYGDLTEGCKSTGSHYNPYNTPHGSILYTEERHVGDLINNFKYDKENRFFQTYVDETVIVKNIIGRSIVIHNYPDDYGLQGQIDVNEYVTLYKDMPISQLHQIFQSRGYKTPKGKGKSKQYYVTRLNEESLKTGNAGGRIACGVIGIAK